MAVFLLRFFLSDVNSYWNDEILSVVIYGAGNETVVDAIRKLANNSIHPPLYQFLLYNWMLVFGDVETATRSLSNLYVTLAGLFLYVTVNIHWSRRTAFFAAAAFSITNLTIQYGLETRSYAQTILLVSISSFVLIRTLSAMAKEQNWSLRSHWFSILVLIGANTALTLTHYYNLFWLLAQALFALVFLIVELPRDLWIRGAIAFVAVFAAAPVLFSIVWGWVFFPQFRTRAEEYQVDEVAARTPIHLLYNSLFDPNVSGGLVGSIIVSVLISALTVAVIVRIARSRRGARNLNDWGVIHLTWWLVMPLVVVYLVFTVLSVERYQIRYFIFSLPPLTALVVIAIGGLVVLIGHRVRALGTNTATTIAMALTAIVAFVPGGYVGATDGKTDWRGNTQRILSIMESDPANDYFLIENELRLVTPL
ncbi:MAG: glycosyltransferase family 39 protein [Microcella pacifica]